VVVRKGDARAGAVLVKTLNRRDGTVHVFSEAVRGDGERFWMQPTKSDFEPDLDAYAERAARIDPDLWVIEIEDRDGRHFLTEAVEA
jgi:hypothetical protein